MQKEPKMRAVSQYLCQDGCGAYLNAQHELVRGCCDDCARVREAEQMLDELARVRGVIQEGLLKASYHDAIFPQLLFRGPKK